MSSSRKQALAVFTSNVHCNVAGVTTIKEKKYLYSYSRQGYEVTDVPAGAGSVASPPDLRYR